MKSVLVTGGAGYIGSHTCKALNAAGYSPVTLDDLSNGHRWAVQFGPLVVGSIADQDLVAQTIRDHQITAVIHFAAFAYVGESMGQPDRYFENNATGMLRLLDAVRDAGVKNVVFSSSCATYGVPSSLPIGEQDPQLPINPYGDTKLWGEKMLRWYDAPYGMRSVALRYFNAAGADPELQIGELHDPETHLVPNVIGACHEDRDRLKVFGLDYPTPDGTAIRDYIHVTDLADAHVRALGYLETGGESTRLNLGTGVGTSVLEVIRAVERASGKTVRWDAHPRREGDPPSLYANAQKARETLGWEPKHSDIDTIARTAWAWDQHLRENRDRYPVRESLEVTA